MLFGRKSEKLLRQIEQLELELEEAYINEGMRQEFAQGSKPAAPTSRPPRPPLPEHLPRQIHEHLPADSQCPIAGAPCRPWAELSPEFVSLCRVVSTVFVN